MRSVTFAEAQRLAPSATDINVRRDSEDLYTWHVLLKGPVPPAEVTALQQALDSRMPGEVWKVRTSDA
jgi:hypothetical protein